MCCCSGVASSPGTLNSMSRGLPPGIQKMRSGKPLRPGVTSLALGTPSWSRMSWQAFRSIFFSSIGAPFVESQEMLKPLCYFKVTNGIVDGFANFNLGKTHLTFWPAKCEENTYGPVSRIG